MTDPSYALQRKRHRENIKLFKRWREEGDETAREELIVKNQALAYHAARTAVEKFPELASEIPGAAIEGLINAIDRFDHTRGNPLSSYAYPWILRRVQEEVARHCHLSGSRAVMGRRTRVQMQAEYMSSRMGRDPTDDEVREELGEEWGPEHMNRLRTTPRFAPIDALLDRPTEGTPYTEAVLDEQLEALRTAIASLPDPTREIILLRLSGLTLREIGTKVGLSRQAVANHEAKAVEMLKEKIK